MDNIKIQNFESVNGEGSFPHYRMISGFEVENISAILKEKMKLPKNSTNKLLAHEIARNCSSVNGVNVKDAPSSFPSVIQSLGLSISEKIYLNWGIYEVVDEMSSIDLLKYFDDIWYPSSDDLDILDSEFKWSISIHHAGMVSLLRFENIKLLANQ